MHTPLFSVLVPAYNRPELLILTVESVLAQTEKSFELIVSDDASPRSADIAKALNRFKHDERFKLILQPTNLGWSDNRNSLLRAASGDFVMLIGDDDLLPSHALAKLRDHLGKFPESELVAFGYEVIDQKGRHVYSRRSPRILELEVGCGTAWREVFLYDVLPMWAFHPFTVCCRRLRALTLGYDKRCGIGDDVLFLFKALDHGCRITVLPEVLFAWRRSLTEIEGYVNLSSSSTANDNARRAIWALVQTLPWRQRAVEELLQSRTFAQHFLDLRPDRAEKVSRLARQRTLSSLREAQALIENIRPKDRWFDNRVCKLNRMRALGGFSYVYLSCKGTLARFFMRFITSS
jgi:glycosyltransferase involved in cell wall biosynthesis